MKKLKAMTLLILLRKITIKINHLNWIIEGKFSFLQSLPTKVNGKRFYNTKKLIT
jgi:hypothetical protein